MRTPELFYDRSANEKLVPEPDFLSPLPGGLLAPFGESLAETPIV